MARALLVLACAAAAAAARYGDYSGARMPLYGGGDYDSRELHHAAEPDDYRGHSPDAPAALDYKYEEDTQIGKTEQPPGREVDDTDSWQYKPKKHKKNRAIEEPHTDASDKFDPDDDFPKPRSVKRFTKHHTRLKSRKFDRQDDDSPKYAVNRRDRNDDDGEEEIQLDKDFRNDNTKSFDNDRYDHRASTERVVRRKPRDRQMRRRLETEEMTKPESDVDRRILQEMGRAPFPGPLDERPASRQRPPDDSIESPREFEEEAESLLHGAKPKGKGKAYDDYGSDYYDMKRVMNIKKKLPTLLRRTTVPEETLKPSTQTLEDFMSNRRIFLPKKPPTRSTAEPPPTTTTTTSTTTTEATTSPLPKSTTSNISNDLSLAEKSRLSILKKAQRKESLNLDSPTKKPPVLLQVTKKLPTVVMVEPPSSQEPWMRAREVFADSPERLAKVKRLMRHKLVASAKNIHELTDNWDDLVCDYVDMSLLDAQSSARYARNNVCFITIFFQVILIFRL